MTREDAIEQARALAPVLRDHAAQAEALRRMPDQAIDALIATKLARITQPARFGGSALGWDALCAVSMELGHGDGSQAWVANVYAEHNFLVALFPEAAQREVWGNNPDALVSASLLPLGNTVERVSGGYLLNGRWPFLSGVHHSHWSFVGEMVRDGERSQHHYFLVPAAERSIVDDWHTMGMVGTGSAAIELKSVFVPEHRALSNALLNEGKAPGAAINTSPIYRMPMLGFSNLALAAVVVGLAEAMVEDFASFVRSKGVPAAPPLWTGNVHARITEAAAEAHTARLLLLDSAALNMRKLAAGALLDGTDSARTQRDSAYACQLARRAANRLFEVVGAQGIFLGNVLQRAFRDIHAATVHAGLNWDRATDVYGRMMTGMSAPPARF